MKVKSITYQRVKNLGNYESERLEASAEIDEGEDIGEAVQYLRRWVNYHLDKPLSLDIPTAPDEEGELKDF